MDINNDQDFKAVLHELSRAGQRQVAARFAENVLALSQDARVMSAINFAKRTDIIEEEFTAALQSAKAASVESFTRCGHECDWGGQAGHFVAQAALSCLKPPEQGANAAWDAAMHARMARTCAGIASGHGTDNAEAMAQYRILAEFLNP